MNNKLINNVAEAPERPTEKKLEFDNFKTVDAYDINNYSCVKQLSHRKNLALSHGPLFSQKKQGVAWQG